MVRRLAAKADGLIEGYRPGVMERLGLGPDELLEANPKLVYGRVTGWGQDGPLGAGGGARHQLCRDHRPAPRHRAEGAAGGADQLSRRLCRRRHDAGVRDGRGAAGGAAGRAGPGDRCGDERRGGADRRADLWPEGGGALARRARGQPARRRRADLRHLSLPRRQVPQHRRDRAAVPRSLFKGLALAPGEPRGDRDGDRLPHPRPVGGAFRRHRRLRRAGARPGRSAGPSAQYGAADVPRPRRRVPAGAGARYSETVLDRPIRRGAKGRTGRRSWPVSAIGETKIARLRDEGGC